ncbi:MAG: metalloregulator ArsR/SmtB family transcription factor [Actinomycetota bacterium]
MTISAAEAEEYASWFRCLSDPTRVRILNHVAEAAEPVTVGEIVEAIGKSQSTVSRHLQVLADDRFVFTEADGVRTLVTVNRLCMVELPRAATAIMASAELSNQGTAVAGQRARTRR